MADDKGSPKLVIGISSRALFDLDDSHAVFESEGVEAYRQHQIEHEDVVLEPGVAFPLVTKLLAINHRLDEHLVEVLLLSRNSSDTGLRVFNSIQHYQLDIKRAAFTGGEGVGEYISAFNTHLFLSANRDDVRSTLAAGFAAARILPSCSVDSGSDQLRIAFDGDAVLFSDDAEKVFLEKGVDAFVAKEAADARKPLSAGPFKPFLAALLRLQKLCDKHDLNLIRTALVTARSAPAHERVIRTLREWDIRVDESLFLGGLDKGEFLRAFGADIFFDDKKDYCDSASKHVATGHVVMSDS